MHVLGDLAKNVHRYFVTLASPIFKHVAPTNYLNSTGYNGLEFRKLLREYYYNIVLK